MNHGNKVNNLGRTASHRKALMSNMATSLILHKRIRTTVAKAKELRKFVEPLITKSKTDSTANRRLAFSYLKTKEPVIELFGTIANKVGDRPGGYTRILRTGVRLGDNAEMCIFELVDFNETYTTKAATTKTRRRRSGAAKKAKPAAAPTEETTGSANEGEQPEANASENEENNQ